MIKQALCILLTLSVILGTAAVPVSADSGGFNYIYSISGGKVEITGIIGEPDIDLELPSHLDGYPVTSIADAAFVGCASIKSVTIPATVTNIGEGSFTERTNHIIVNVSPDNPCYSSQNGVLFNKDKTVLICYPNVNSGIYTIPDSVTEIGAFAFSDCAMLQSVIIPNGVTVIGRSAFYDCTSLTSVTLPSSVICIEDAAFSDCSALKSVSVGSGVTDIEVGAFYGCSSLTAINVSKYNPVYSSQGGVLFNKSKTAVLLFPRGKSGTYTIPSGVKSIGHGAFQRCERLTAVTICDSVEHICDYAFADCTQLNSVKIGSGVSAIGDYAFRGCGFTEVVIPNSVTDIGEYAFAFCEQLYSVTIGGGVKNIGIRSFYGCRNLAEIMIPDSVEHIGEYAFADCEWLYSVTIGRGVNKIGSCAFSGTRLNQVHISDLAAWCHIIFATANANPLYYAPNLYIDGELAASLVIPDSVTKIGKYAFYNCGSVISVILGDGVKEIGQDAFYQCSNLLSINVSEENPYYSSQNGALFNKDKTTLIYYVGKNPDLYNIPDGVTEIGAYAFSESSNLEAVTIPDSVTSIGDHAFYNCHGLNVVEVGVGVSSLDSNIFTGCNSITDIYYRGSAEEWNEVAFPSGLGNLYLADVHFNSTGIKKYYSNDHDYYDLLERLSDVSDKSEFIGIVENNSEMLGFNGDYSAAAAELLYDMYRYDIIDDYMSNECKVKTCVLIAALNSGTPISGAKYVKRIYRDNETLSILLNDAIISEETDEYFTQVIHNTYGFIQGPELLDATVESLLLTIINYGMQEDFERYLTSFGGGLGINYRRYVELREDGKKKAFYDFKNYHISSISQFKAVFNEICLRYTSTPTNSSGGGGGGTSSGGGGSMDYTQKIYEDYTCRLSNGEAIITCVNRAVCGSVKLPSFIEGCPVTCIESGAFEYFDCITAVEIPLSVTVIEDNAFRRCDRLTDVYYYGDEEDWSGVYIDCGNEALTNAEFHYISGGQASFEIEPTLKVLPTNAKIGDNVILAAFKNSLLYSLKISEYSGTPVEFAVPEEYDELKIMLWDSITGMKPLAPARTK